MSSGCGDVLSLADLQTAKKHQIFEAEVITGKSGGVAAGADIDYATNAATGQVQKTLPAVLRDAGFSPVSWDFSTGGTLTVNDRDKVVYDPVSKTWYSYTGALPVTVPAGFNPVGNASWKPQTDPELRSDLSNTSDVQLGDALVGVKQPYIGAIATTQHAKNASVINVADFGAKGDFSTDDTAAIQAALTAAAGFSDRGAVVVMNAGIFNISAGLTIPEYVALVGAGRWSTIIRCTTSGSTVDPIVNMPNQASTLSGVSVVYAAQQTQGTCIRTEGARNTLTDFSAQGGGNGVQWWGGSAVKLTNFDIYDCSNTGLQLGKENSGFINDLIARDFFIISGDSSNFSLGAIRAVGRLEAVMLSNFDCIGSTYPFASDPGTTEGLRFSNFTNGFFDEGRLPAIFAGVNHTTITDCWFSQRNAGAIFDNCHSLFINGVRVYNCMQQGFIVKNSHHIQIQGDFANNNIAGATDTDDIYIDTSNNITIKNITGYEAGNTRNLVFIGTGCSAVTLKDIRATPRASGNVNQFAANNGTTLDNVTGFVSWNRGTGTLPAGATSTVVNHGLGYPPFIQNITLTPNGASATPLYVSGVTSTTFTVMTQTANSGVTPFSWFADIRRV